MSDFNWHQTGEFEKHIRSTPEVHDCEWVDELSPKHDIKRVAAIVAPLLISITAFLYAGREIVSIISGWLS